RSSYSPPVPSARRTRTWSVTSDSVGTTTSSSICLGDALAVGCTVDGLPSRVPVTCSMAAGGGDVQVLLKPPPPWRWIPALLGGSTSLHVASYASWGGSTGWEGA